jgi:hypothetical protein
MAIAMTDLVTQPMGKGIDTKSRLLKEEAPQDTRIDQAAFPITPTQSGDHHWEKHSESKNEFTIVFMLPHDDWVLVQVGDICPTTILGVLLQRHPHKVGVPHALPDTVWIFDGIGPSMVCPMLAAPPSNGALDGTAANTGEKNSQWQGPRERKFGQC